MQYNIKTIIKKRIQQDTIIEGQKTNKYVRKGDQTNNQIKITNTSAQN